MDVLIRECIASRPGLFENRSFALDEKITIIRGRNNSGKSLLARAIIDLLHMRRTGELLLGRAEWEDLYMDAVLADPGGEYRITRNGCRAITIKSIEGGAESDLVTLDCRGREEEGLFREIMESLGRQEKGRTLHGYYGIFDGGSLASLCYMPSPVEPAAAKGNGYGSLQRVFVDDSSNFYEIFISVSAQFGDGQPGRRMTNPLAQAILSREGELKGLERRIEMIDLEYSKYEKLIRERREVEGEIAAKRDEIGKLAGRKEIAERVLENLRTCGDIEAAIAEREHEIAGEVKKTAEIDGIAARAHDLFPQFRNFSDSQRNNLRKIQDLYRELRDANEELNNLLSGISHRKKVFKNIVLSMNIAALFAIILTYGNIFINIAEEMKPLLVTGLLVLALTGVAALMTYNIVTGRKRALADLNLRIEDLEGRIEKLLRENNVRISEYRMETLYEFLLQYFEEYSEYTEMQLDILRIRSTLKDGEHLARMTAELEEMKTRLSGVRDDIGKDLELLGDDRPADETAAAALEYIFATEKNIEAREAQIQEDGRILVQLDEEIRATSFHDDEKKESLDRKRKMARALDDLRAHQESMEYILKIFRETIGIRWKRRTEKLVSRSAELFHELTEKQYITRIDGEVIRSLVEGASTAELHQNVLHLIHLSIKLAMTDFLIDLNLSLPLIIDDPFLFMDEVRIARLKEILDDISETRQVIVFTHGSISSQWGKVIEI
jgi:uncharacterized protein YhaN